MEANVKVTLAGARKSANLTQKEVAEILGVTPQTVLNWEHGKNLPVQMAIKLCELYQMPIQCIRFV